MNTLETCLGISGSFEGGNGGPCWGNVAGDFDGMTLSVGALQQNIGTGSIQELLSITKSNFGGTPPPEFSEVFGLLGLDAAPARAYAFAKGWLNTAKNGSPLTLQAATYWKALLTTHQCIAAQTSLAQRILDKAVIDARAYVGFFGMQDNLRALAFFFDVRVQQGGMARGTRRVESYSSVQQADPSRAIQLAKDGNHKQTEAAWTSIVPTDDLASVLLSYAYDRASLGRPEYLWDCTSRRGTIACRKGGVHGKMFDFSTELP